jgi:hypothetical protein
MAELGRGGGEIGRSVLAVVSSLVVFVVVSLLAFLVALRFVEGVIWPAMIGMIGVFCGFAAATVLNATDVMARWSRRDPTDRAGPRERPGDHLHRRARFHRTVPRPGGYRGI